MAGLRRHAFAVDHSERLCLLNSYTFRLGRGGGAALSYRFGGVSLHKRTLVPPAEEAGDVFVSSALLA
jgi:hypothetical protein